MQISLEQRTQFLGQPFRLFVEAGADMKGLGFEEQGLFFENAITEVDADAFERGEPGFDGEQIVVAGGRFVAQAAFDYGEDGVLLLPLEKTSAKLAKELAPSRFEDVKVTRVIDVVANGTLGIGNAMLMLEDHSQNSKIKTQNSKQIRILKLENSSEGLSFLHYSNFGLVSSLELRISNFCKRCPACKRELTLF